MRKVVIALLCVSTIGIQDLRANSSAAPEGIAPIKTPSLKYNFKNQEDRFVQFNIWGQFWMRTGDLNPGSMIVDEPSDSYLDMGVRRVRMSGLFQFNPRYRIYAQVGVNNQSYLVGGGTGTGGNGYGKKPGLFFHDIYNEYTVTQQKSWSLHLGGGLHGWSGISRLTNGSSSRILGLDFPMFQFPNIERSDQFGRQFGVFARGHINKINYRASVNKPFKTDMSPSMVNVAVDNNSAKTIAHGAYAYYQFFETESLSNPYLAGSYLGEKKVLNLGLGYYSAAKAGKMLTSAGNIINKNHSILSADLFAELPFKMVNKKSSLTIYSAFYRYNMGDNYLRMNGVMNPGINDGNFSGPRALEGPGNQTILLGTGNIAFAQLGWLLPQVSNKVGIQPYFGYSHKHLQAINKPFGAMNVGANVLLDGHNAKLSAQYSQQQINSATSMTKLRNVGEFILQAQIFL